MKNNTNRPKKVHTDRIARIWETEHGFMVCNFYNAPVTSTYFGTDSEAGEYARGLGFQEIIWED